MKLESEEIEIVHPSQESYPVLGKDKIIDLKRRDLDVK